MYAFIAFFVLALGIFVSPAMAQQQPIRTPSKAAAARRAGAAGLGGHQGRIMAVRVQFLRPLPAERPPAAG